MAKLIIEVLERRAYAYVETEAHHRRVGARGTRRRSVKKISAAMLGTECDLLRLYPGNYHVVFELKGQD